MGRKGGGKKGFLKSAVRAGDAPEPEVVEAAAQRPLDQAAQADGAAVQQTTASEHPPAPAAAAAKPAAPLPSSKAVKVEPSGPAAREQDDSGEEGEANGEAGTRGQIVQRHKKEMKAHKDQMKKLGKKRKDEVEKLDADIDRRHAAELDAWDCAHDTATVTRVEASLYATKLDASSTGDSKKATKAQKRREKQQQEEAERDARIAEEQAELGDSQRTLEERALAETLDPLGLALRDIPPDGHCLYRSVDDQLSLSSSADGSDAAGYQALRKQAAGYMRAHEAEYLPFVVPEDGEEAIDLHEYFDKYCRDVEDTAAWGGQVELGALSHALQRHIVVYSVGLPAVDMGAEYKGKAHSLRVCYQRHAWALGEHYNSVVPKGSDAESGDEQEDASDSE